MYKEVGKAGGKVSRGGVGWGKGSGGVGWGVCVCSVGNGVCGVCKGVGAEPCVVKCGNQGITSPNQS